MQTSSATQIESFIGCAHCASKVVDRRFNDGALSFCCAGCRFVYGVMSTDGLTKFYSLRDANPPTCPVPAKVSDSDFSYYDDAEFLKTTSDEGRRVRFFLEGMNCSACVWLLEKLPDFCPDVASARVDLSGSTIEITRTPLGSFAAIGRKLNQLGYRPHPLKENESSTLLQTRERRKDLIRIGVAGALTGNIMILTVSLYGGADGFLGQQFHWLTAALATPVLTYCAWPFYRSALSSVRQLRLNIDVPIVIAILAGVFTTTYSLLQNGSDNYFDSLSMLVFLLLSSRHFLRSIQNRHLQATNVEDDLLTGTVQLVGGARIRDVNAASLQVDDLITLPIGSMIPIDGVVESGFGSVSAAVMTGESVAINVVSGSKVEAGYRYLSGTAVIRVTHSTRQSRLAQILRETEKLAEKKSHVVQVADRAAQYFIMAVFCSAIALVAWFSTTNPSEGISRALALVIVTCPCVFGMAIPLSMAFAIRRAARVGIIVKQADAIERLWHARNFFFDKTATLTSGSMKVVSATYRNIADLRILHGLQQSQLHPVGRALASYARSVQAEPATITEITALQSGGVAGRLLADEYSVRPRERRLAQKNSQQLVAGFSLFKNQTPIAQFELEDQPRTEALPVLEALRENGLGTYLLSGDREHIVRDCGRTLEFTEETIFGEMTPESKAAVIQQQVAGSVMIGDGANDAAALASASVGIAVCGSLDVSLRAADIYLTTPDLNAIPTLLQIARQARVAILRNLAFSASFNIVAGTLAAAGYMTPLWAAVIMPISSLIVLVSAAWGGAK